MANQLVDLWDSWYNAKDSSPEQEAAADKFEEKYGFEVYELPHYLYVGFKRIVDRRKGATNE